MNDNAILVFSWPALCFWCFKGRCFLSSITDKTFTGLDYMSNTEAVLWETIISCPYRTPGFTFCSNGVCVTHELAFCLLFRFCCCCCCLFYVLCPCCPCLWIANCSFILCNVYSVYFSFQSISITTKVVSLNSVQSAVYSIQHYVIKFVSDLKQVDGFHRVLRFPPPIKHNT
jgi:hypothetical protein